MKQLIIGIDGGDEEILGYFQMPFYESLITKSKRLHLVEDCWSRGWAEMYTGMHARETKAFYELPNLDGTLKFNRRYSWKTSLENPKCKMLWDVLESQGVNSLFMNIPTTFPCPEMKHGCFVAGAGGGLNNVSEIPDGLCSDPSIKEDLNLAGYIVDLRYKTSGIKDLDELFEKLNQMMMKRAECFVTLCKKKKTEFGFLVFRATTIVQYVARSEIEELANLFKEYGNDYKPVKKIHKLLIGHFRLLDDALKHIFTELSPEKYIVTADHGCVPFKKRMDVNHLLAQQNLQSKIGVVKNIKKALWKMLPRKYFNQLKSLSPKSVVSMAQGYQPSLTKAFGNTNIHGVYINDEKRFNGPVKDGAELNEAVNQICGMINGNRIAQNNSISAKPYRRNYSEAFYSDYLPDIWIDHPDTIFPEKAESFISTNENYGPIESLESVPSDVNSGQKGARPLFITDLSTFNSLDENNDLDLTIVYEIVSSEFS